MHDPESGITWIFVGAVALLAFFLVVLWLVLR